MGWYTGALLKLRFLKTENVNFAKVLVLENIFYKCILPKELVCFPGLRRSNFHSLCSNNEDCEECGDYVRRVFSFLPGSLAALSLLIVLLFPASKKIFKTKGDRGSFYLKAIFESCLKPLFQSETMCEAIDMKMIIYSHAYKTHFHNKGFTLSLVLKSESFWNSELSYFARSLV